MNTPANFQQYADDLRQAIMDCDTATNLHYASECRTLIEELELGWDLIDDEDEEVTARVISKLENEYDNMMDYLGATIPYRKTA